MQQVTMSVLVGAAVFFVLLTVIDLVGGSGLSSEVLIANGFRTLIFAMAYAAVKVAVIIFKGDTK